LALTQLGCAQVLEERADVVIGTAATADIDYPLGGSICRLFNLDTPRHGLRCAEEPSAGPVANIESLRSGRIDIGIVPSDVLVDAVVGQGPFAGRGSATDLRVLFAAHADVFTLVAHQESGIRTVADLRGKRIGIGSPGSRQRANMERVMAALDLTPNDFAEVRGLSPAEQNRAFCAHELDAIVYSVGHPNGLIRDATFTCHGMLVAVSGPAIDRMLSAYQEYERATIPGGTYPVNSADVPTFGVRAVVVTTTRMPDTVAYEITRAVFDNFDDFRRLHPAFEGLSIAETVRTTGHAPVHTGAARYYRERGWLA
jgi:TRAP transporter TAXI family solute receptor